MSPVDRGVAVQVLGRALGPAILHRKLIVVEPILGEPITGEFVTAWIVCCRNQRWLDANNNLIPGSLT